MCLQGTAKSGHEHDIVSWSSLVGNSGAPTEANTSSSDGGISPASSRALNTACDAMAVSNASVLEAVADVLKSAP